MENAKGHRRRLPDARDLLRRRPRARAAADEHPGLVYTPPSSVTRQGVIKLAAQYSLGFLRRRLPNARDLLRRRPLARAAAVEQFRICVTPPSSVAMQCVIKLAVQHFLGFLVNWAVVGGEELTC